MTSRAFSVYSRTLKMVLSFKYLGRVLSAAYDDWPAVIPNPKKGVGNLVENVKGPEQGGGEAAGVHIFL